jgi:hypothetical protein
MVEAYITYPLDPQPAHPDVVLRMNYYGNAEADLPLGYPDADPGVMAGQDEWICPAHAPGYEAAVKKIGGVWCWIFTPRRTSP